MSDRRAEPDAPRCSRRSAVAFGLTSAAVVFASRHAAALGRTPRGGTLRLAVPFTSDVLDPHAVDEPLSALFSPAVADPLYALDAAGSPYPALAAELPQATPDGVRVTLREGLTSARGKALDARDVLFSCARARERGGAAVLSELPAPVKDPSSARAVLFPGADARSVALALASPLTALVPRGFNAKQPDGTGAFRATLGPGTLLLERNPRAARGPSFLGRVELALTADLAEALRAFESERVDVGWLGAGLHQPRSGAVPFEGPTYGWVVLRAGRDAGRWGTPGVLQALLDPVPRDALRHLGLVPAAGAVRAGAPWGGGNVELCVSAASPTLGELAASVAAVFSVQRQTVTVRALPANDLRALRASGKYALMLDFVRQAGPPGRATLLSLLAAANPALAARPPQAVSFDPVDVARTLPLGVLGALRVAGARMPDVRGLETWQLGNVFRVTPP